MISFIVYGEPIGKARPRVTRYGHAFTPKKSKDYELAIKEQASLAMNILRLSVSDKPIILEINVFKAITASWTKKTKRMALNGGYPKFRKPDLDNVIKAVKDALNGVVYQDDTQVVKLKSSWRYDVEPRIEVNINEVLQ